MTLRRAVPRPLSALGLMATAAIACVAVTAPEPTGTVPVAGAWSYSGQQSGAQAQLSGSLDFTSRSAIAFNGSADISEAIGGAVQRRLTGPLTGRVTSGTVVEFDLALGVLVRRHIARLTADTISGTWLELSAANATVGATGSFRAVRRP